MNRRIVAVALLPLAFAACKKAEQQAAPADTVFTGLTVADSLNAPESVLYDARGDAYLVANINGDGFAKDDNGFISRVNPDGRVDELRFIDGAGDSVTLHAPKGMGIRGDTLFVADIDEVRLFDRMNGRPLGSWRVPGAVFLNDISVGPDGTVYVTESGFRPDYSLSGNEVVYRFDARGTPVRIARGGMGGPNGVLADSSGIVVSTSAGDLYRFDARGTRTTLPKPLAGGNDGLVRLADGTLLISSWADSSIQRLAPGDTAWRHERRGINSPADIGLDTRRNRVLVPQLMENRVQVLPLR